MNHQARSTQQGKQERLLAVDFLQIRLPQAKLALAEHILPDFTSISSVASLFRTWWCGLPQENNLQMNFLFYVFFFFLPTAWASLHNPHSSPAPSLNLAIAICVPVVRGKWEEPRWPGGVAATDKRERKTGGCPGWRSQTQASLSHDYLSLPQSDGWLAKARPRGGRSPDFRSFGAALLLLCGPNSDLSQENLDYAFYDDNSTQPNIDIVERSLRFWLIGWFELDKTHLVVPALVAYLSIKQLNLGMMTCDWAGDGLVTSIRKRRCRVVATIRGSLFCSIKNDIKSPPLVFWRDMLKPSVVFFSFVILAPVFLPCAKPPTLLRWDFSFAEKVAGVFPSSQIHWVVYCWKKNPFWNRNVQTGVRLDDVSDLWLVQQLSYLDASQCCIVDCLLMTRPTGCSTHLSKLLRCFSIDHQYKILNASFYSRLRSVHFYLFLFICEQLIDFSYSLNYSIFHLMLWTFRTWSASVWFPS